MNQTMTKAYKLMRPDMTTHNGYPWEFHRKEVIEKPGTELCTDQVFHAYRSAELGVLLNPAHAYYRDYIIVEIECDIVADDGLKIGSKWQKPIRLVSTPEISDTQRIRFACLCERSVCHLRDPIPIYDAWRNKFIQTGRGRASMARRYVWSAQATMPSAVVAWYATRAAEAASRSVDAAEWTAKAAWAASRAAGATSNKIDFVELARKAIHETE